MNQPVSPTVLHRPLFFVSFPLIFLSFSLPIYAKSLGASALEIGGLFTVFTVSLIIIRPMVGVGLDRYGRRWFLISALLIYAVTSLLFSAASSLETLYLARLFQGIGASLLLITVDTITTDLTTADNRAQAMGRNMEQQSRGGMVGIMVGFTLMGALQQSLGWQAAFVGYSLMALLGAFFAFRNVPESSTAEAASFDWHPWRGLELKPRLIRLMVVVFIAGFAQALIQPIYLIYLQDHHTVNIMTLGWAFFPAGIVYMLLPSRMGKLSDRFGRAEVMAFGFLLSGLLYSMFPFLPNLIWLVVLYTLSAVGGAMADPARQAMVGDLANEQERGRIYGVYELVVGIGASLGPLLGGWIYDNVGQDIPFFMNGFLMLLAAVWAGLTLRQKTSEQTSGDTRI
jgi:DHA1 family multidrug resistance protein-like MFS transporter